MIHNNRPHENGMPSIMHTMMEQMTTMEVTGDPDHDFAAMMITHHQGAIQMAREELQKGEDDELRLLAQKIITKQEAEIELLNKFLRNHIPDRSADGEAFDNEVRSEMPAMPDHQATTGNVDTDLAVLMVPHHEHAISMARALLRHGKHKDLKQLASTIISDQSRELRQLKRWRDKHKHLH